MGHGVIHDLMDIFWEGAQERDLGTKTYSQKAYSLVSNNYRSVCEKALEKQELPERYHRLQLVTDYICGMTDTFACTLHKQLKNG